MGSRNKIDEGIIAIAVVASSAVLVYFGTGLHPIWWTTWLAPLPVLWFAGSEYSRAVFWIAFAAWLVGDLTWWHYIYTVLEIPILVCIQIIALAAVLFGLCVLLWRRLLLRGQFWLAAFWLPVAWTALGFILQEFSPNSTFGNIAYSQMSVLPLIQISAITGIWGIAFLLLLIPSATAILIHQGRRASGVAAVALACLLLTLGFGAWRLHAPMQTTGTVRAQLMTNDKKGEVYAEKDVRSLELLQKYVSTEKSSDVDVLLIPEKIARFSEQGAEQARGTLSETAKSRRTYVLAGLDELRDGNRRNDAVLFAPDGRLMIDYEKHHFVPGIEIGYLTGTDYSVIQQPSGVWGVTICKDMDFPALGRQYGKRGVGLLLVPAWDFAVDDWYHARMAILRGVESGFSIARAAKQGLLTVSDNRGRIFLAQRGSTTGLVSVEVFVPVAHANTLYARWGDWFPWFCVAGVVATLILAFRRNNSQAKSQAAG